MTRVNSLLASAVVATFILGCNAGPEDTVVPSEPTASMAVRPAALGPAAQGATVFKFRAKGAFADVFWDDGSRFGFLSVTLTQSQTGGKPLQEAFLFYDISQCGAFGCDTVEGGLGPIPVEDVSADGKKSFSVHTDTGTNPDFVLFVGSGGPVDVDWSANDFFSTRFHGVSQVQIGDTKVKSNGSFSAVSATAMGSVVGSSVEGVLSANIGTNHDRFIQIDR